MGQIDLSILVNWVVSGLIGIVMGVLGGWFTYRYQKKLDDIRWEREKKQRQHEYLVQELTKGLDNPKETIEKLSGSLDAICYEYLKKNSPGGSLVVEESRQMVFPVEVILVFYRISNLLAGKDNKSMMEFRSAIINYAERHPSERGVFHSDCE